MSDTPATIGTTRSLRRLYNQLHDHFGPRHWWPADHPWEMMVGAILVQNTAWTNVEKAIARLKEAGILELHKIARLPRRRLQTLIRSSGYFRQKAERLQAFARYLVRHPSFYDELIGGTPTASLTSLRERLLELKGIGPETADSILLYAGGYPTFVVDAYTRRIGHRLGLFKVEAYDDIQRFFESALPKNAPMYNEFHALLVSLAKEYCKSQKPLCQRCPLIVDCRFGHKHAIGKVSHGRHRRPVHRVVPR